MATAGKICIAEVCEEQLLAPNVWAHSRLFYHRPQVEEIVEAGSLHPDEIHLPGIYVNRLIKGTDYEKRIEVVPPLMYQLMFSLSTLHPKLTDFHSSCITQKLTLDKGQSDKNDAPKNAAAIVREKIARRAALEFQASIFHVFYSKTGYIDSTASSSQNGMYCNLGIGIPTLASNYIPSGIHIELQSENGLLGMVANLNVLSHQDALRSFIPTLF